MSYYNRRRASSTSIYHNLSASQPHQSRDVFVNYDYLESEEHNEYANAWFKNQGYRQFPNEYIDEYTEKWVEYTSLSNEKNHRIQYTSIEFLDILRTMGEEVPTDDILNKLERMQDVGKFKVIYQTIRNPINPVDNNVKGFAPGIPKETTTTTSITTSTATTTGQLCTRCKAELVNEV